MEVSIDGPLYQLIVHKMHPGLSYSYVRSLPPGPCLGLCHHPTDAYAICLHAAWWMEEMEDLIVSVVGGIHLARGCCWWIIVQVDGTQDAPSFMPFLWQSSATWALSWSMSSSNWCIYHPSACIIINGRNGRPDCFQQRKLYLWKVGSSNTIQQSCWHRLGVDQAHSHLHMLTCDMYSSNKLLI